MKIRGKKRLKGEIKLPGDKSISHRAVILGSISEGETNIRNILLSNDTLNTIEIFQKLGVSIEVDYKNNNVKIIGKGLRGLVSPNEELYCGNSGTSMRLLSGILSAQKFPSILTGDESLSKRPMNRVVNPLSLMNANIKCYNDNFPPIEIFPANELSGIEYTLPVASAQVKSAILLASLYSEGQTIIRENKVTRDHTERMLDYFGVNIEYNNNLTRMNNANNLYGKDIEIPGDISSAAFFIVAATTIEGSSVILKDVGINPTRIGIIDILLRMGADIKIENSRVVNNEPVGDLIIKNKPLSCVEIKGDIIGTLIDEIPIIAVAASLANGDTIIRNAEELKNKETDRILAISKELNKMGANIEPLPDGLIIHGNSELKESVVDSHNDHRIAMALSIAALNIDGITEITNSDCIDVSYPEFYKDLGNLTGKLFEIN